MLKLLRKQKFAKKIFYLLAIIIVPSFILWGSATAIRDRNEKGTAGYAGKIFNKKVSFEEYLSALHAWRNELRMRFGAQANQAETLLDSNESTWDKLILLYEAKRLKIKVSNDELTVYVTSLPFLQREGIFSPELYDLFLKYSLGTPARIFEEQIRDSLKIQRLFDLVTNDAAISDTEVKDRYKQENEQIKVKYVAVFSKDLENEITVNDVELNDYYEKNKEALKIPIQINLKYAGSEFPDQATEEQKQDTLKKVIQIQEAANKSSDLAAAAEGLGLQIKETGFFSLGEAIPGVELPIQNTIVLFNLKENQASNIMQTPQGIYIFRLKEKRIDYIPSFEEAKERVKNKLVKEKAKQLAKSKIEGYSSKINSEKQSNPNLSLVEIANKLNLAIPETDFFTRKTYPQELEESDSLIQAAFNLSEGEISQPVELEQGYVLMARTEFKPIDEEKFQKDKEDFKKALLEEKKNNIFDEYFAKLKSQAHLLDYVSTQQTKVVPTKSN